MIGAHGLCLEHFAVPPCRLRIDIEPAKRGDKHQRGHDFQHQVPVSMRVRQDDASDDRSDKSAQVADAVNQGYARRG